MATASKPRSARTATTAPPAAARRAKPSVAAARPRPTRKSTALDRAPARRQAGAPVLPPVQPPLVAADVAADLSPVEAAAKPAGLAKPAKSTKSTKSTKSAGSLEAGRPGVPATAAEAAEPAAPAAPGAPAARSRGADGRSSEGEAHVPRKKLVRDSFTMPREDFDLIADMKTRAIDFRRPAKKSELLRAGLQALAAMSDFELRAALEALTPLPAGRPKKKR